MPINRYISTLLLIFAVINIQAQGKKALICGISDYPDESGFADIHGNISGEPFEGSIICFRN